MTSYFISIFSGNEDNLLLDYLAIFISSIIFALNITIILSLFIFNIISGIPSCLIKVKKLLTKFLLFSIVHEFKATPIFSRQYITIIMLRDTITPLMIAVFPDKVGLQVAPLLVSNGILLIFIIFLKPISSRAVLLEEIFGIIIYVAILGLLLIAHLLTDSISETTKYYFFGNMAIFLILLQFGIFVIFCITNGLISLKHLLNNYKIKVSDEDDSQPPLDTREPNKNILSLKEKNELQNQKIFPVENKRKTSSPFMNNNRIRRVTISNH